MARTLWLGLGLVCVLAPFAGSWADTPVTKVGPDARIEVRLDARRQTSPPTTGRVVVVLSRTASQDLRRRIGDTGMTAAPIFGTDAKGFTAAQPVFITAQSAAFPISSLAELPAGEYYAQAIFKWNPDLNLPSAPGNLFSPVKKIWLGPGKNEPAILTLSEAIPDEQLPADTERVKYLKFPSKLLSDFHGRPMFYRAAVVLPPGFNDEPNRRYPLRVHIGGFGSRYTFARFLARGSAKVLTLVLDGAGPNGDPYQVNSANNGPYGDALTQELIPYVEKTWRGVGKPEARFTDGGSTGGWVSLALLLFYPDFFGGCWSQCPDSLDFRSYELINIYQDTNAYVNSFGFERPAKRTVQGDTIYTVRHETQVENVLGLGDSFAYGGKDWCSWNATYGPKGEDGQPVPLWNPKTGEINRTVQKHWEKYDLRLVLERNWATLGPKVNGKIRVWVGDADDYFLNNGVHFFKQAAERLKNPKFEGRVQIEMRMPHTSGGWTSAEMLRQMEAAGAGQP